MGQSMAENTTGKNVLITSAGRRVSLVQYFMHAVSQTSGGQVFAVDMNPSLSAACQLADGFEAICSVNNSDYINQLLAICQRHDVSLVVPTIDTELMLLANIRDEWAAEHNINIVVSRPDLVRICRDKRQTSTLFAEMGLNTPTELESSSSTFPRFIKPIAGSRSIDIHIVRDASEMSPTLADTSYYLHQELVDTKRFREFTVDAFYDSQGSLRSVVPRERLEVRDGEVSKSRTHKGALVTQLAAALTTLEGAYGCLTLQFFVALDAPSTPEILGIEINPRFGGGYPLSQLAGATYVDWLVQEHFTGRTDGYFGDWIDGLLMLRYDAEVFVRD